MCVCGGVGGYERTVLHGLKEADSFVFVYKTSPGRWGEWGGGLDG